MLPLVGLSYQLSNHRHIGGGFAFEVKNKLGMGSNVRLPIAFSYRTTS